MVQKIYLSSQFMIETCIKCGIVWAMLGDYISQKRNDHKVFYCPNGHGQHYLQKSDTEKLQEQLKHCRTDIDFWKSGYAAKADNLKTVKRSRGAYKAQVTKLKKELHGENGTEHDPQN